MALTARQQLEAAKTDTDSTLFMPTGNVLSVLIILYISVMARSTSTVHGIETEILIHLVVLFWSVLSFCFR
jgi:hypothetical protein